MSLLKKIFYNTLAQSLGKLASVGFGLLTIGLLTRHLAEAGFGQYATVLAFLGISVTFADLGLYLIVTREISKPESDNNLIISNALGFRITAAIFFLMVGGAISLIFPYDPIVKSAIFLGIAAFVFSSANQVLVGIFQKHLVQYWVALSELVARAVGFFFVWWFVSQGQSLHYFIVALAIGNATQFFITLLFARRYERFSIAFNFAIWRSLLQSSWPLAFAVILNLIYFKADTVILSYFRSDAEVGIYGFPYKILEVLLAFPAMFVGLILPLLSNTAFNAWDKFREILQKSFDALLLIALPMVITVWFFAEHILELITGSGVYLDSPNVLKILIVAAAVIFFGTLFGYAIVAVNKQYQMIYGYLAGVIVGLTSYFVLIPRFSYFGAAVGTLLAELVVAIIAYWLIRSVSKQHLNFNTFYAAVPGVIFLSGSYLFLDFIWYITMAVGLLGYLITLLLFQAIPVNFVKEIIMRK